MRPVDSKPRCACGYRATSHRDMREHMDAGQCQHPGCTCPMTGDPPAWHHDDCAAHDPTVRWPV